MLKDTATRITNAETDFISNVMEQFSFTREQAKHILTAYRLLKVVTLQANIGRYSVKHGAFWEKETMLRALQIELQ